MSSNPVEYAEARYYFLSNLSSLITAQLPLSSVVRYFCIYLSYQNTLSKIKAL